jgi:hypothetical protein
MLSGTNSSYSILCPPKEERGGERETGRQGEEEEKALAFHVPAPSIAPAGLFQ